jgi:diguanylate cyclase (GGDEF)-like protein
MNVFKEQMRWKILLLLSLLLLGVSFILTAQHVFAYKTMLQETFDEQKSLLKENMLLQAKSHTESLAIQLENELAAYNFSKFADSVTDDVAQNEHLSHAYVFDLSGKLILNSQDPSVSQLNKRVPAPDINSSAIDVSEIIYNGQPVLVLQKKLDLGSTPWGVLTLFFTQTELEQKVLHYAKQMQKKIDLSIFESLLSMLLFLVLFLPLAYSMALHISRPIIDLTKRAEELSKGNFTPQCIGTGNRKDELGMLERSFNKMSENLRNSYNKLEEYNLQLEQMVQSRTAELEDKNIKLEKLSVTDSLTQLYNRVKLDEVFTEQVHASIRYNTPFSILLCDVDFFKRVNDTFGHLIGDKILAETAKILSDTIRETDIIGRWGGEEFLIICRETDKKNALQLAQRLRTAVESHSFISNQRQTISIGVSSFMPKDSDLSMLARADRALYSAKDSGRNCVSFNPS